MHIPDGFLSGAVNTAGFVVAAGACGVALARANRTLGERQVPLLGITAAFIFAAQMLNFPIGMGTSGHFLGAMLAALLLGPLNACLIMALVLAVQCLLFSDGGITALGTNIANMGVVGVFAGYGVFRAVQLIAPAGRKGFLLAATVGAWASVVVASVACALELAWSGTYPLQGVMGVMVGLHALIGAGEAIITTAVLSTVLAVRPDLVLSWRPALDEAVSEEALA